MKERFCTECGSTDTDEGVVIIKGEEFGAVICHRCGYVGRLPTPRDAWPQTLGRKRVA